MAKRKNRASKPKNPLDTRFTRKKRGRPGVRASEIRGRADNYRVMFGQILVVVGAPLLKAQTEPEVIQAFQEDGRYTQEFSPIASLILKVIRDPKFPKTDKAQIGFLADSLAGRGQISPRTSRNICERERKKKLHQIIRQEYYILCTCGYKGPALYGNCPKCGPDELSLPFLDFFS